MSIEYIGDGTKNNRIFDVSYYWLGEERMISGSLSVMLDGKSDFGAFSLSSNKLKN